MGAWAAGSCASIIGYWSVGALVVVDPELDALIGA